MLAPGDRLKGHYVIERELGRGGMGAVYLAHHEDLDAEVAIKELIVPSEADALSVDRFRTEGRLLHRLRHARLPVVYDFFKEGDQYYLAMEFVEGEPLSHVGREIPTPDGELLRSWGLQLCEVLEYLHSQDPVIIFRDLKPSNVMLTRQGDLKLIDFGIAKRFDVETGGETSTAIRGAGTPGFAPTEQYGAGTDERSDIYALGATLYSLATGKIPPPSVNLAAGTQTLKPLQECRPDLPAPLCQAVHHMMSLRREDRPASMTEVRSLLYYQATRVPRPAQDVPPAPDPRTASGGGQQATSVLEAGPAHTALPSRKRPAPVLLPALGVGLMALVAAGAAIHRLQPPVAATVAESMVPHPAPTVTVTARPVAVASQTPRPPHRAAAAHTPKPKPRPAAVPRVSAVAEMPTPVATQTIVYVTPSATASVAPPPPPVRTQAPPPQPTPDLYRRDYEGPARAVLLQLSTAAALIPASGKGEGLDRFESAMAQVQAHLPNLSPRPASLDKLLDAFKALQDAQRAWEQGKSIVDDAMRNSGGQGPGPGMGPPGGPGGFGGPPPGGGPPGGPPQLDAEHGQRLDQAAGQLIDARTRAIMALHDAETDLNNHN